MNKIFGFLLVFAGVAFGQNSIDVTNKGAILTQNAKEELRLTNSVVTQVVVNGSIVATGNLGTVSFTTPVLETGTFQTDATFGEGGEIVVDVPGFVDYVGNFAAGAQWQNVTLANGTHQYTLLANFTSMNGPAQLVCQTVIIKTAWVKSAKILACDFNIGG